MLYVSLLAVIMTPYNNCYPGEAAVQACVGLRSAQLPLVELLKSLLSLTLHVITSKIVSRAFAGYATGSELLVEKMGYLRCIPGKHTQRKLFRTPERLVHAREMYIHVFSVSAKGDVTRNVSTWPLAPHLKDEDITQSDLGWFVVDAHTAQLCRPSCSPGNNPDDSQLQCVTRHFPIGQSWALCHSALRGHTDS